MALYILLALMAAIFIILGYLNIGGSANSFTKEASLQNNISKTSVIQLMIAPLVLMIASGAISVYKGLSSAQKGKESYIALSQAAMQAIGTTEQKQLVKELTTAYGKDEITGDQLLEKLITITTVPYFGQSELFLAGINLLNTVITLAFVAMLMFIISGAALKHNKKILNMQEALVKIANYDLFFHLTLDINDVITKRFKWKMYIGLILYTIGCVLLLIFVITSIALKVQLSMFMIFFAIMFLVYEYNAGCSQADNNLFVIAFLAGFTMTFIYSIDIYFDYKYTIEIGNYITAYHLEHRLAELKALQTSYETSIGNGSIFTAEMLYDFKCVINGNTSIKTCLDQLEISEITNHNNSLINQITITIIMVLIDIFTMVWSSRTGEIQKLLDQEITRIEAGKELSDEHLKNSFNKAIQKMTPPVSPLPVSPPPANIVTTPITYTATGIAPLPADETDDAPFIDNLTIHNGN